MLVEIAGTFCARGLNGGDVGLHGDGVGRTADNERERPDRPPFACVTTIPFVRAAKSRPPEPKWSRCRSRDGREEKFRFGRIVPLTGQQQYPGS